MLGGNRIDEWSFRNRRISCSASDSSQRSYLTLILIYYYITDCVPDLILGVKIVLHKGFSGFIVLFTSNKIQRIQSVRLSVKQSALCCYCFVRQRSVACELRPLPVRLAVFLWIYGAQCAPIVITPQWCNPNEISHSEVKRGDLGERK